MADVMAIAKARREKLRIELAKLNQFIQTAESLLLWHEAKGSAGPDVGTAEATGSNEPTSYQTGPPAGAAAAGAA